MNPQSTPWERLAAAARRAPIDDDRDVAAPYGFAVRVAALAMSERRKRASFFDQFSLRISLRALGVAGAMAVIAAGTSYSTIAKMFSDNVLPPDSASVSAPAAAPVIGPEPSDIATPAPDTPAANPSPGDDPVAELVNIVS
jgi:hypothetical protein